MDAHFKSTMRLNSEEVTKLLEKWARKYNLNMFFIQIAHIIQGEYVIFYDGRLDEEIY
jgi:hypothetical protein